MRQWLLIFFVVSAGRADSSWKEALALMPVATNVIHIAKTEPPRLILGALRPNEVVKAIVFLPAATDELYFFDHGLRSWTNSPGSLADALAALTNGTPFQITFQKPLLLIHLLRDRLDPLIPEHPPSPGRRHEWSGSWIDTPWDRAFPELASVFGKGLTPQGASSEAWHFYRMYMAGQGMGPDELLRAVALAGRLQAEPSAGNVHFSLDRRPMLIP